MGMLLWIVGVVVLFMWLLSLFMVCTCLPSPQPLSATHVHNKEKKKKKHVLLVIAHPDDESMFFAPTLLSLASLGCYHVRILCLSNGNAEGLGATRKQEMLSACFYLKVPMENVDVIDDPALQDGHNVIWSQDLISQILERTFAKHNIDMMITFDNYGVSGHANHIAVHRGVCRFVLDCAKKLEDKESFSIEAWQLVSVSIIKKYSGPMYVLWSMWNNRNTDQSHSFYSKGPQHSIGAMRLHGTQWLWYRRMFVIFSHYTYMNTLHKINL